MEAGHFVLPPVFRGSMLEFLKSEGVSPSLIKQVEEYRKNHIADEKVSYRIPVPTFRYFGKDIWEQALTAALCGENILLTGGKATGKNLLSENLATVFARPAWNISLHVNMDASSLIGMDTLENGQVVFRAGPIYNCAVYGGFGILDEINMAKSEALAVLHAVLDSRRLIDIPGYDKINLASETRFIGTMNYGYIGTKELNEALTSRFSVIAVPTISEQNLIRLISETYPKLSKRDVKIYTDLIFDIGAKADSGEISSRALDIRGLLSSLKMVENGLDPKKALAMGLTNKTFDNFERKLVTDIIDSRI